MMTVMAMMMVMAVMTNGSGHDDDNDHDDDNGLTDDSKRLLLTDSSIRLCFVIPVCIPQVAAQIQKGAQQCNWQDSIASTDVLHCFRNQTFEWTAQRGWLIEWMAALKLWHIYFFTSSMMVDYYFTFKLSF